MGRKERMGYFKAQLKHLFKTSLLYSIQGFDEKGIIPGITQFLVTGLGALPVRKGMSLTTSEEFYDKYFKDESKYRKEISELDRILKDNGYTESQIRSAKTRVRNRIKEERER
jgi:hypothetical protein